MKFSHSLLFNAVPDWIDYYVSYDHLKRIIFQIEKEKFDAINSSKDIEKQSSITNEGKERFLQQLDAQLDKVLSFYTQKETELFNAVDLIDRKSIEREFNNVITVNSAKDLKESSGKKENHRRISFESRFSTQTNEHPDYVVHLTDLRSQMISLYVSLSELESYIDLNRLAFEKILKKYDKVLEADLRQPYLKRMMQDSRPFMSQTIDSLRSQIERLEYRYANIFCHGDIQLATRHMKTQLRDQVTYDRNTIWKDMVNQERKTMDAHVKESKVEKTYQLPFLNKHVTADLLHSIISTLFSLTLFIILLNISFFGNRQEDDCFALLIFAAVMWATEAIPLYATSLMLPFLIVILGILCNPDGTPMDAKPAASAVFHSMFSGTVMMLLGGFSLAAALSKYGIAKAFASHVLSRAGTQPRWVLLAIMSVACFLCMWISNVATPVLCFSLIQPILRTLPDDSTVAPCLLLGIALASCIGGMTSPIASPQNIVTIQYMSPNPGWGVWFGVALPISIISLVCCWAILLLMYRPDRSVPHLNTVKATRGKISWGQAFVMAVTTLTIALWCAESSIESFIGETGVIAAIPLFMFFGTGVLNKDDLNAFLWSVVVLAQGGMALGSAVTSSGLLKDIGLRIKETVQFMDPIAILAIFCLLILVFSTFVSHTVAALIIVPIVQQVGQNLPVPHPNLLVMGAGLACSAGMGLPVSGYPNMSAIMMEDLKGKPYLRTKDFIWVGVPTSVIVTILIFTLAYGIMIAIGY